MSSWLSRWWGLHMQIGGWSLCDWWSDSHEEGKKEHCLLPSLAPVSQAAEMWSNRPIAAWWHLCTPRALAAETFQPENTGRVKEGTSVSRTKEACPRPAQNLNKLLGDQGTWFGRDVSQSEIKSPWSEGNKLLLLHPCTAKDTGAGCSWVPAPCGWRMRSSLCVKRRLVVILGGEDPNP